MLSEQDKKVIEEAKAQKAAEAQARQDRIDELNREAQEYFDRRKAEVKRAADEIENQRRQKAEDELRAEARRAYLKNPAANEAQFNDWFDNKGGKEQLLAEKARIELQREQSGYQQTLNLYRDKLSSL